MTTHSNTPAGWYPDPHGAPQTLRYWDGVKWTEHTNADQQGQAAQQQPQAVPQQQAGPDPRAQRQVKQQVQQQAGVAGGGPGGGSLFTEPVLVVNQKAKLIELTNEYKVMDQNGNVIGSVDEVGQSTLKKAIRLLTNYDQFLTHKFEVRDANHSTVLKVTRPAKVFKSRFLVTRADETPIGEIVQENVFGKIRFGFVVDGRPVGGIFAENWRAWNFSIRDHTDTEVARVTKTWGGFIKAAFTTADNYVVEIPHPLPDPLASMVVAAALTIDTALKQDTD